MVLYPISSIYHFPACVCVWFSFCVCFSHHKLIDRHYLCVLKKALARYFAHACKVLRTVLASVDGMFELLFDLLGPLTSRGAKAREDMEKGRERRKSEGERSEAGRTLFVRNLPYSTTDDQLASVFAEYGAVKTCFTIKDKGVYTTEIFSNR